MQNSLYQDRVFRRIVVASTGLGFACMFGSLRAIQIGRGVGLQFTWHWSILLVAAAAIIWNARFWKAFWEAQDGNKRGSRKKLMTHLTVLVLLGIGSFLYPIRFIEQSYWSGILKGLATAVTFLGTMVWLIYKVAKGFGEIDSLQEPQPGGSTAK